MFADGVADEDLRHLREVADDVLLGVRVPRAEDRVGFLTAIAHATEFHGGADGNLLVRHAGKIGSARTGEIAFGLALLAHEHALLLLGALVLEILAKVAVAAGDLDVLPVLRDLLRHEVVVFLLADFEAFPRDDELVLLVILTLAGDEHFHLGVSADDAAEQRALVQLLEMRRADELAHHFAQLLVGGDGKQVNDEILIVREHVLQAAVALFLELVALHRGEDRTEHARVLRDLGIHAVSLAAEPLETLGLDGVLAQRFVERISKFIHAPLFYEEPRGLGHDLRVAAHEERYGLRAPVVAERLGHREDDLLELRDGQFTEERGEVAVVVAENGCDARRVRGGGERRVRGEDFVALREELERLGGLELEVLFRRVFDRRDDGLELRGIGERRERLGEIVERGDLLLQRARGLARGEDFFRLRERLVAEDERIGLLAGHAHERVGLQRALRGLPPLLERRIREDIRHELRGDLICGRASAEAVEHVPHERSRVGLRELFHGIEVLEFFRSNVIGRQRRERFARVLDLHRMALLRFEINRRLAQQEIVRDDDAVAPALVLHESARREFCEGGPGDGSEFAGFDCLLDVFCHIGARKVEGIAAGAKGFLWRG